MSHSLITTVSDLERAKRIIAAGSSFGSESARYCVADAAACLAKLDAGTAAPHGASWATAAVRWSVRALEHEYGFSIPTELADDESAWIAGSYR